MMGVVNIGAVLEYGKTGGVVRVITKRVEEEM
jgi:hypothetical protein